MKCKIVFISILALLLNACDNSQSVSEQTSQEQTSETAVTESAPTPAEPATPVTAAETAPTVEEPAAQPQAVAAVAQPLTGEAVYKKSCIACHGSGAANAPKVGDKAAWKPRIEKGMDKLLQSAINGVPGTAMMKRGNCAACTDAELKSAIEFMVGQSK